MLFKVIPRIKIIFTSLSLLLLLGCAAKGQHFSEISTVPEGQAMLYIYRPWAFTGGGVSFPIVINDKRISPELSNQSYLMHSTQPGIKRIHTDTTAIDRVLEFTAEPNQTYFIGLSVKNYFMVFAQVPYLVDEKLALKEMKKCQLAL